MARERVDLGRARESRDLEKVAGVVLMTNIFDIIAQFIMEYGQPSTADSGEDGTDD